VVINRTRESSTLERLGTWHVLTRRITVLSAIHVLEWPYFLGGGIQGLFKDLLHQVSKLLKLHCDLQNFPCPGNDTFSRIFKDLQNSVSTLVSGRYSLPVEPRTAHHAEDRR